LAQGRANIPDPGEDERTRRAFSPSRLFYCGRARAEARIGAEHWVRQRDPLSWLRFGRAGSAAGSTGWTQPAKMQDQAPERQAGEEDPELMEEVEEALREADAVTLGRGYATGVEPVLQSIAVGGLAT
jgi:hypothetical protein